MEKETRRIVTMMDTLVLSSAYQPMSHISWQKAIGMWFAGKVEIVEFYKDRTIKTIDELIQVPAIVRFVGKVIKKYEFNQTGKFSRENVYYRDNKECQYCSKKMSRHNFTLDHVIPASQGGKKNWENIVACCHKCNQRKGSRTPEQAGMKLNKKPIKPLMIMKDNKLSFNIQDIPDIWKDYLP